MAEPLPKPWTVDDFLAWEVGQTERYEFVEGIVYMMVGGSAAHTIIKGNAFTALERRLRGGSCRALTEGLKVVTAVSVHYPDVTVICSPIEPTDDRVREPVVIVEVLSRSTADRDRGAKWVAYRELPSLRHYVLLTQDRRRAEVFTRTDDGWALHLYAPPDRAVPLSALRIELGLDEIYEGSGC